MYAVSRIARLVLLASAGLWITTAKADTRPPAPPPSEANCANMAAQMASNDAEIARLKATNGYLWRVAGNSDPTVRMELSRNDQSIADLQAKNKALRKEAEACGPSAPPSSGGR